MVGNLRHSVQISRRFGQYIHVNFDLYLWFRLVKMIGSDRKRVKVTLECMVFFRLAMSSWTQRYDERTHVLLALLQCDVYTMNTVFIFLHDTASPC